jgi:hypothetical protein
MSPPSIILEKAELCFSGFDHSEECEPDKSANGCRAAGRAGRHAFGPLPAVEAQVPSGERGWEVNAVLEVMQIKKLPGLAGAECCGSLEGRAA